MPDNIASIKQGIESLGASFVQAGAEAEKTEVIAEARSAQIDAQDELKEAINPNALRMQRTREKAASLISKKGTKEEKEEKGYLPLQEIKESIDQFTKQNQQFKKDTLDALRKKIHSESSKEDILKAVTESYPHSPYLASLALEFLLKITVGDLKARVMQAKNEFDREHKKAIEQGQKMAAETLAATGRTPEQESKEILDRHREMPILFDDLSKKYASFKQVNAVITDYLHRYGEKLKPLTEGKQEKFKIKLQTNPESAELITVIKEIRTLQSIKQTYAYYHKRMSVIHQSFQQEDLKVPDRLNFENLAKAYMECVRDRDRLSPDRIEPLIASRLGLENNLVGVSIVLGVMQTYTKEAPAEKIFGSTPKRDEFFKRLTEAVTSVLDKIEEKETAEEEARVPVSKPGASF